MKMFIYIFIMAGVTYLIRFLPFTLFRKKIKSRFIKSFLFYIPYTVLAAMTIPDIFSSTGDTFSAAVGTITAAVLAFFNLPLIAVALTASLAAYIAMFFI